MRLPGQERRRQIIDSAAALFSRKGFSGTTTREVAKAAGVSEATLFKHFTTKEDLYAAIIEAKAQSRAILGTVVAAAERKEDAEVLRVLAREMVNRTKADPTLLRLLFFSALEGHALSDMFFRSRLEAVDLFLTRYIAQRVEDGAFRHLDPMLAAWNFIGMLAYHILFVELFGQKPATDVGLDAAVEQTVSLFLHGIHA